VLADPPDPDALPPDQQATWREGQVAPLLAWFGALLDWPAVEPQDLRAPTLWVVGSKNEHGAMDSYRTYGPTLPAHVRAEIIPGLDHFAELTAIDQVLPRSRHFCRRRAAATLRVAQ
jgi:hypothetical protein